LQLFRLKVEGFTPCPLHRNAGGMFDRLV